MDMGQNVMSSLENSQETCAKKQKNTPANNRNPSLDAVRGKLTGVQYITTKGKSRDLFEEAVAEKVETACPEPKNYKLFPKSLRRVDFHIVLCG